MKEQGKLHNESSEYLLYPSLKHWDQDKEDFKSFSIAFNFILLVRANTFLPLYYFSHLPALTVTGICAAAFKPLIRKQFMTVCQKAAGGPHTEKAPYINSSLPHPCLKAEQLLTARFISGITKNTIAFTVLEIVFLIISLEKISQTA